MLFDYTNISIDSINKDCSESLNLCRKIVEEIKNETKQTSKSPIKINDKRRKEANR